jgi:hypothetical protein
MTNEKAIEVIKENCYRLNPMDLDETVQINQALDKAVESLQSAAEAQEIIRKFRELQQTALKKGYTQSGGYCRGVTDCLRIMLNEYEVPESPGDFETRGCCS